MSMQIELDFEAADKGADKASCESVRADHRRSARACSQRKTKAKNEQAKTATLEEVIEALEAAFEAVRANKGAPGPTGKVSSKCVSTGRRSSRNWPNPCCRGATELETSGACGYPRRRRPERAGHS